jgi:hypothetical protein
MIQVPGTFSEALVAGYGADDERDAETAVACDSAAQP